MAALVLLLLAAQATCPPDAQALVPAAFEHAQEFDVSGAADRLRHAVESGCSDVEVDALYVRGLVDAREAFRQGAPPAALASVHAGIDALQVIARNRPGRAEIARLVLQAAAAAAQSERGEMALYLDQAMRMEGLQRAAGQPGAPIISASEVAGDLWLQIFGYAEARVAFMRAADEGVTTLGVMRGLARTAARLGVAGAACAEYRALLDRWGSRQAQPPEIAEARAYLGGPACGGGGSTAAAPRTPVLEGPGLQP